MNSKLVKVLYIIAGCFFGIGIIYYLGRIAENLFVRENTAQWLLDLNVWAIVCIAIGFVVVVIAVAIPFLGEYKEKKVVPVKEEEILEKYKSKKKIK